MKGAPSADPTAAAPRAPARRDSSDSDDHNTTLRLDVITDNVLSEAGYRLTATGPDGAYIGAPHPRNEGKRAKVLQKMEVVDTVAEERFDVMTRICERVFDVPIALVSLIDSNRQWFKSCIGLDVRETPRDMSFCAWTLLPKEPMCLVVPNALEDPRFKGNPLVTGPPNIRFYAGAPLIGLDGARLGALCIIDVRPRILSQRQLEVLSDMGKMCSNELQRQTVKNEHGMEVDKLERDNSLLLTAMEQMEEGVVVVDINADGKVVFCNNGWERLTGISRSFAMGKSLYALLNEERAGAGIMSLCAAMRARENKQVEVEIRRGDGKKLWCQSRANLVKHDAHELYTVTLTDITKLFERNRDLKSANRSLMRLQDVAESASQAKQSFLANMSHEIRTPMNAIVACSGLLLEQGGEGRLSPSEGGNSSEVVDLAEIIHSSSSQLLHLINDVLDFSKIESNNVALEHAPFDLFSCIDMCMDMFANKAREKNLHVAYSVAQLTPMNLYGDEMRIRQVISNLLSNAVKFTDEGEVELTVGVHADALPNLLRRKTRETSSSMSNTQDGHEIRMLHFVVRDTGCGIGQEMRKSLFMAFQQADSSRTRKHGGTGLGLTISKWLVEQMGGNLWLESEEGKGATFHFTIEVHAVSEGAITQGPVPRGQTTRGVKRRMSQDQDATSNPPAGAQQQCYILVVSKSDLLLRSAECLLSELFCSTKSANSLEAVRTALNEAPDTDKNTSMHIIVDGGSFGEEEAAVMDLLQAYSTSHAQANSGRQVLTTYVRAGVPSPGPEDAGAGMHVTMPLTRNKLRKITDYIRSQGRPSPLISSGRTLDLPIILVAEDNLVNQRVMGKLLSSMGMTAVFVDNGLLAVNACREHQYDIVLMDLQMPVMDGLDATRAIISECESNNVEPPCILACTADVTEGVLMECQTTGMSGYISKPLTKGKLMDVMGRVRVQRGGGKSGAGTTWGGHFIAEMGSIAEMVE